MEQHLSESVLKNINIESIAGANQLEMFEAVFIELLIMKDEMDIIYLNPDSMKFVNKMIEKIYDYSFVVLKEKFNNITDNEIKHIYAYISRGCAQMVISWLANGMLESPKIMAKLMVKTLKGEFYY